MENTISQLLLTDSKETIIIISSILGVGLFIVTSNWDKIKLPYEWLMAWYKRQKRKDELLQMLLEDHNKTVTLETEVEELHETVDAYSQNRVNDRAQSKKYQADWLEAQKQAGERSDTILEQIQKISEQLADLSNEVKTNREHSDRTRIKDIRSRILDFANSLPHTERSIDELEEIFDLDEEYITLLDKYGEKNGRTTRAIERIKEYYDKVIAE